MRRAQWTDMETELPNDLLVKVDRMAMAFGVEARVPFLDHRIVEFGLSLPRKLKVRPHHGKVFLKRWAEGAIPPDHLWRPKRGFHVPVEAWFKGTRLHALEQALQGNQAVGHWFSREGLRELFKACRQGKGGVREIWGVMQFAIWHRLFVEERGGTRPSLCEDPLDFI